MPFKKPGQLADETFTADNLDDCGAGAGDFLSGAGVDPSAAGPEIICVFRMNGPIKYDDNGTERTWTGAIYVGKAIDEIKNDLK